MPNDSADLWLPFEPKALADGRPLHLLLRFALELGTLAVLSRDDRQHRLNMARKRAIADSSQCEEKSRQALVAAVWVLTDLVRQGWAVRILGARLEIRRPPAAADTDDDQRARIREQLHAARSEQLREPAVRMFIRAMETRRLYQGHFVSIFSLMRDGVDFAAQLRNVGDGASKVAQVIQPYLQFVRGEERCEFTGLKLSDVWRYFRHPGRTPTRAFRGAR
jgi:hypothetical protein